MKMRTVSSLARSVGRTGVCLALLVGLLLIVPGCGGGYVEAGFDTGYIYIDDPFYEEDPYWDAPCGCYYYKATATDHDNTW